MFKEDVIPMDRLSLPDSGAGEGHRRRRLRAPQPPFTPPVPSASVNALDAIFHRQVAGALTSVEQDWWLDAVRRAKGFIATQTVAEVEEAAAEALNNLTWADERETLR